MDFLDEIFAIHEFPRIIVSDNATLLFTSNIFKEYCKNRGIFITPSHPAINGFVERNVQTLKQRLKCMAENKSPMGKKSRLSYFDTKLPRLIGKSPDEL